MSKNRFAIATLVSISIAFSNYSLALEPKEIFQINKDSIGVVLTESKFGSGVVIDDKTVLTNCHVISGSRKIEFKQGKKKYRAVLYEGNPALDLCKLVVPQLKAKQVRVRGTSTIKIGERVYAIGNPEGYELTISEGLVSGLRDYEDSSLIQTSAPIAHGSSGGGLFDTSGKLIGITSSSLEGTGNINFAIPVSYSSKLANTSYVEDFGESTIRITPKFLDNVMDLYERQAIDEIVSLTQLWLKQDRSSAYAWTLLGSALGFLDEFKESKAAFLKALEINPEFTPALDALSSLASRTGENGSAYLQDCVKATHINNSLLAAYQALCKAKVNDDSGIALIDNYLNQDPSRSWLHTRKAATYFLLKNYDLSEKSALKAIGINQKSAEAYALLAGIYFLRGDYQTGRKYIDSALSISPRSPGLLELSAMSTALKRDRNETEAAIRALELVSPARAELIRKKLSSRR